MLRLRVNVGEVTAATTRNQDFLAGPAGALKHGHPASAPARFGGAEQAGSSGAQNNHVESAAHVEPLLSQVSPGGRVGPAIDDFSMETGTRELAGNGSCEK